jgi:nucleoside-diphosphate-sugar epimerase
LSRILVLGAGYIGAKVAQRALAAGDEVVLADNWSATQQDQVAGLGAAVETADVRSRGDMDRLMALRPDRVIYLAAQASRPLSWRDPSYTEQSNLVGARHVAEAVGAAGGVPVVYGSSLHVYGTGLSGDVGADAPYGEQGDLAHLSKVYGELCLRMYARRDGWPLSLLRLAIVHGPSPVVRGPEALTVVDKFRRLVEAGEPLVVDDPEAVIGVVHVEDAARLLLEADDACANVVAETMTVGQVAAWAQGGSGGPAPRWRYTSPYDYEHRLT